LEAARRISHEWGASRPLMIAMTASAMQGDKERCLEAGMDDYITKPMRIGELQRVLMHWGRTIKGSSTGSLREEVNSVEARRDKQELFVSSSPGIDLTGLMELREMQVENERDIVNELVNLFLRDTPHRLATIRLALSATDFPTAQREAHEIKGSCAELGAHMMSSLSAELEQIEHPAQAPQCEELLTKLETEFVRVKQVLNSVLVAEAVERT